MTKDEVATIVTAAGSILHVLAHADGRDKADIYRQLGLCLTFQPEAKQVITEATPSAIMYKTECPRPDLDAKYMIRGALPLAPY
jgi:site-specific DNA recombinase